MLPTFNITIFILLSILLSIHFEIRAIKLVFSEFDEMRLSTFAQRAWYVFKFDIAPLPTWIAAAFFASVFAWQLGVPRFPLLPIVNAGFVAYLTRFWVKSI